MTGSLECIRDCGVLPVVEIPEGSDAVALVDALKDGGLCCVEITLRTVGAVDAIRAIRATRPDVVVAAGTVLTVEQADDALAAGAALLVSPGFSPRIVDHAIDRGGTILPGVSTPTEIEMGLERGIGAFKFFPAEAAGGTRCLEAISAPYPAVRFVPTGGIDATNLGSYLTLPNVLACGGSWMVTRRVLADNDLATVRRLADEAATIVRKTRSVTATG